ncbi:unnamed protein product [Urochloa decumbens]|uniref:UMP kinase n=1 Tax=Urochloa decumbens TaxID=240449 RepID=A0ABC9EJH5_9POAL
MLVWDAVTSSEGEPRTWPPPLAAGRHPSMSSTCNDVYFGFLDDDCFGLTDDDPLPPPLPSGFDLPRKPPVNAAAHFCATRALVRMDNRAAVVAKHSGGCAAAAAELCDVGENCSPYLNSGSEGTGGCEGGAADYGNDSMGKWSDEDIASLIDKDTELSEHLDEGHSQSDVVKSEHQQQQDDKSCAPPTVDFRSGPLPCPRWKRALLKIGGSVLAGSASENVDPKVIMLIAKEVQVASLRGVQVAVVVGSGNIYRGDTWAAATGIGRAATSPVGMMASVMNAMLLQASLERVGIEARVQTALVMQVAAEPYIRRRAIRHLEKGRVVIFGGIGAAMGNPLLTTDAAAALRASEINADVLLKGIIGDSQYGCPPGSNGDAKFEHISYQELMKRGFGKLDVKGITFCKEHNIPFVLFNMLEPGNISRALCGELVGTLVDQTPDRKDQLT